MKNIASLLCLISLAACSSSSNQEVSYSPLRNEEFTNVSNPTTSFIDVVTENTDNQVLLINRAKHPSTIKLHMSQVLHLEGEVNSNVDRLIYRLNKMNTDNSIKVIYLLIDSPGGSVMDGARFVSAMEASKKPIYTVCMSLCASMAAVIHQYGTKRIMLNRSTLMFHDASGGLQGTLPQMQTRLTHITGIVNKMDGYIASRSGIPLKSFLKEIQSEIWLDSDSAISRHFDDEVAFIYVEDAPEPEIARDIFDNQYKKYNLDVK